MSQFWSTVFAVLTSSVVVIAVLGFFGRSIVSHFFNVQLEKLRAELKDRSADYELKSTAWNTQRIRTTQRIYARVQRCHLMLKDAIWRYPGLIGSAELDKVGSAVFGAVGKVERYVLLRKAYIDDDLRAGVEQFLDAIRTTNAAFIRAEHLRITEKPLDRQNQEEEAERKFESLVQPSLGRIETRMRETMLA